MPKVAPYIWILLVSAILSSAGCSDSFSNEERLEIAKNLALKGDPEGQHQVGSCYFYGWGVVKDQVEAVKWYQKAADQGHAYSQYTMGLCYSIGEGVAKDQVEAQKWYRKAADQGNHEALSSIGDYYKSGLVIPKNSVEAYAYYNLAGTTNETARFKRNLLEQALTEQEIIRAQQRTKELQKEIEAKIAAKKAGK